MDQRLDLLEKSKPDWFTVQTREPARLAGYAYHPKTRWRKTGIELVIEAAEKTSVAEPIPGTLLPKRCAERHIQWDSTFCLGLRPVEICNQATALVWWEQLGQFLHLQSVAAGTGVWSQKHSLDHGDAGELHLQALARASELGMSQEYEAAHAGERSWITDRSLHIVGKSGEPLTGRLPCPLGCHHSRRPNKPVVRKDCPRREKVVALVNLEIERRKQLARYWRQERAIGTVCCGTMRDCPIRDTLPANEDIAVATEGSSSAQVG